MFVLSKPYISNHKDVLRTDFSVAYLTELHNQAAI